MQHATLTKHKGYYTPGFPDWDYQVQDIEENIYPGQFQTVK